MIQSDSQSNPAMNTLINDYTTYHVVLVVAGGFFVGLVKVYLSVPLYYGRCPNG
jgi:hypothetical protein